MLRANPAPLIRLPSWALFLGAQPVFLPGSQLRTSVPYELGSMPSPARRYRSAVTPAFAVC